MIETSTNLSVLGDDDGGESNLTYSWSLVSAPTGGDAWFSPNDSHNASGTCATFSTDGPYDFTVTITDSQGLFVTSDPLEDTVVLTLSTIVLTPDAAAALPGQTSQFAATGLDQFNHAPATQPTFAWSASAGSITQDGTLTAPPTGTSCTVTASAAGSVEHGHRRHPAVDRRYPRRLPDVRQQRLLPQQRLDRRLLPGRRRHLRVYAALSVGLPRAARLNIGPLRTSPSDTTGSNILYAGTLYQCDRGCHTSDGAADMAIEFASPTGVGSFDVVGNLRESVCPWVSGSGSAARYDAGTMTVYLTGGQTVNVELHLLGTLNGAQVALSDTVSLSQYGLLDEIELDPHRIPFCNYDSSKPSDYWLTHYYWDHDGIGEQEFGLDNLQLVTFKPALLSLTAADAADPTNHVTAATDAAIADLYLPANGNDAAEVNFTAAFTPPTYDSSPTGYYVNLVVTRDDAPTVAVYQTNWYWEPSGTSLGPVLLEATPGAQSFTAVLTLTVGGVVLGTATEQIDLAQPQIWTYTEGGVNGPGEVLPHGDNNSPGAYVPLNNDDDAYDWYDGLGKDDHTYEGPVTGEDDLLRIDLQAVQGGTYTVRASPNLRIWPSDDDSRGRTTSASNIDATTTTTLYVEGYEEGTGTISLDWTNVDGQVSRDVNTLTIHVFAWKGALNVPDYSKYQYLAWGGDPDTGASGWLDPVGGSIDSTDEPPEGWSQASTIKWNGGPEVGHAIYQASPDFTWDLKVNVVRVQVTAPNKGASPDGSGFVPGTPHADNYDNTQDNNGDPLYTRILGGSLDVPGRPFGTNAAMQMWATVAHRRPQRRSGREVHHGRARSEHYHFRLLRRLWDWERHGRRDARVGFGGPDVPRREPRPADRSLVFRREFI